MYELERKPTDYQEATKVQPSSAPDARAVSDIREPFELWLDSVKADSSLQSCESVSLNGTEQSVQTPTPSASKVEFLNACEVRFKGTLHVDGYFTGNVRSDHGTLVLAENGEINTDIVVGVARINGTVVGNIDARQRIELGSAARVIGDLYTPALTVMPGAIFEGKCYFRETSGNGNGRRHSAASGAGLDESPDTKYARGRRKLNGKKPKAARRADRRRP